MRAGMSRKTEKGKREETRGKRGREIEIERLMDVSVKEETERKGERGRGEKGVSEREKKRRRGRVKKRKRE